MVSEADEVEASIRDDLRDLANLLESHNYFVLGLSPTLDVGNDALWGFLTSNSLWGGAGLIADQALLEIPDARRNLEAILIRLGRSQQLIGRVNVRTEMWVSAFEKLRASDQ